MFIKYNTPPGGGGGTMGNSGATLGFNWGRIEFTNPLVHTAGVVAASTVKRSPLSALVTKLAFSARISCLFPNSVFCVYGFGNYFYEVSN